MAVHGDGGAWAAGGGQAAPALQAAGWVPAGLYARTGGASVSAAPPETYAFRVHVTKRFGLAERVRRLLRGKPKKAFRLAEVARELGIEPPLWELGSAMCKLVARGEVVKGTRAVGGCLRLTYQWTGERHALDRA